MTILLHLIETVKFSDRDSTMILVEYLIRQKCLCRNDTNGNRNGKEWDLTMWNGREMEWDCKKPFPIISNSKYELRSVNRMCII